MVSWVNNIANQAHWIHGGYVIPVKWVEGDILYAGGQLWMVGD